MLSHLAALKYLSVSLRISLTKYLSIFSPNAGKYGPEITRYLDTFHTVMVFHHTDLTSNPLLGNHNNFSKNLLDFLRF